MSTIFTNYLSQQEQPAQATHADSSLLKKTDDLFKTPEKKNEKDTSLLEETTSKASQPGEASHKIEEPFLTRKRYSLEFKQRAVSEICSGKRAFEVCKTYNICSVSLKTWRRKAYAPNIPYNSSVAWAKNSGLKKSK